MGVKKKYNVIKGLAAGGHVCCRVARARSARRAIEMGGEWDRKAPACISRRDGARGRA